MKGSLKTVRIQDHTHNKTNFNDWCGSKYMPLKGVKRPKVTEDDLNKFEVPAQEQSPSISSQTSVEIEQLREYIKEGYPLLSQKEIRNVKLPFYESLLLNLIEDGFLAACEFIKDLITLDEEWHKQRSKDSSIRNRPFLKSNTSALNSLINGLTKAEVAKKEGNKTQEIRSLLDMAIYFSSPEYDSWYWLAEELYEQCVTVAVDSTTTDDPELEAIAKHIFATFLLDVIHDPKRAKPFVEESMQLSVGKFWNASEITGKKNDILYFESCLLLHKIFLEMAHEMMGYNTEDAIQLCRSALHWAKQVNSTPGEATALVSLVVIYIEAGQLSLVLDNLEKYMKLCKEQDDNQGLCEGYILLATYHDLIGQNDLVIEDIKELLEIAQENKIMKMIALAHRKLATFYLIKGKEKEMQQHVIEAYSYYVQLGSKHEMEETRCLTGIAQAQEIMSQYINILLQAENLNIVEFKILMLWKTLRIPFFSNVKLFQPEADENSKLRDRIETIKNEELVDVHRTRQAEMTSVTSKSQNQFTVKHILSASSGVSVKASQSVMNFQRHLRGAMQDSVESMPSLY